MFNRLYSSTKVVTICFGFSTTDYFLQDSLAAEAQLAIDKIPTITVAKLKETRILQEGWLRSG